jgi:hypothetical protein
MRYLQSFFIGVAENTNGNSATSKGLTALLVLTSLFGCVLCALIEFADRHGVPVLRTIAEVWPWQSDNFRDPRSIGFAFLLFFGLPIFLFWLSVYRKCVARIRLGESLPLVRLLLAVWFFLATFGTFFGVVVFKLDISLVVLNGIIAMAWCFWFEKRIAHIAEA